LLAFSRWSSIIGKQNLPADARFDPGTPARHPLLTIAERLLLAALLVAFVVSAFLPACRTMNTDFPNYYLAASLCRHGIPSAMVRANMLQANMLQAKKAQGNMLRISRSP
jgi:hypothetical protein